MKFQTHRLEEGGVLELEGEVTADELELPVEEFPDWKAVSYRLQVEKLGTEYYVHGRLHSEFKLACARCAEPIPWTVSLEKFACSVEDEGQESIDLTPQVREDILLALPIAPACKLDASQRCPYTGKNHGEGPDVFAEQQRKTIWGGLEGLKFKE
jgi:uncharacterized protein